MNIAPTPIKGYYELEVQSIYMAGIGKYYSQ
jgi:hypothetical protein